MIGGQGRRLHGKESSSSRERFVKLGPLGLRFLETKQTNSLAVITVGPSSFGLEKLRNPGTNNVGP